MKQKLAGLSQRYATALQKYLKPGSPTGLPAALRLGREAVTLGLTALELSRIHKQALARLEPAKRTKESIKRAELFFANAATPFVEARREESSNQKTLNRLNDLTNHHAAELAAANHQLQRGMLRRESIKHASHKNGKDNGKSLTEALELQKRLRQVTHGALAAHEDDRTHLSQELQDDVVQTLVGVNARLIALKQQARTDPGGLKNEIASTRRLVVESTKSVRRLARKLRSHAPEPGNDSIIGR